jgi:hypothetical protein
MRQFHKALFLPATAAVLVAGSFLVWQTVIAAPALSFGGYGQVHFAESAIASGSEPLLCFDAVEWQRLCPGSTFTKLTPVNVSARDARAIDLESHVISTPTTIGRVAPKCRATRIPAGLAPGVWKLTGHASNTCSVPFVGGVTVSSLLPEALVTIRAP